MSYGGGTNNHQLTKSSNCNGDWNSDDESDDDNDGNKGDGGRGGRGKDTETQGGRGTRGGKGADSGGSGGGRMAAEVAAVRRWQRQCSYCVPAFSNKNVFHFRICHHIYTLIRL